MQLVLGLGGDRWEPSDRAALSSAFAAAVAAGVCFCAAAGDNSVDDGTNGPERRLPVLGPQCVGGGRARISRRRERDARERGRVGRRPARRRGRRGRVRPRRVPDAELAVGRRAGGAVGRGVPDTSRQRGPEQRLADVSANGSWTVVGGTSAASPFTAALIAVAKAAAAGKGVTAPAVYLARVSACNDVTIGSNGDPPRLDGTRPRGSARRTAPGSSLGRGVGAGAPAPSPAPTPPPAAPLPATSANALTALNSAFNKGPGIWTRNQAIKAADAAITSLDWAKSP